MTHSMTIPSFCRRSHVISLGILLLVAANCGGSADDGASAASAVKIYSSGRAENGTTYFSFEDARTGWGGPGSSCFADDPSTNERFCGAYFREHIYDGKQGDIVLCSDSSCTQTLGFVSMDPKFDNAVFAIASRDSPQQGCKFDIKVVTQANACGTCSDNAQHQAQCSSGTQNPSGNSSPTGYATGSGTCVGSTLTNATYNNANYWTCDSGNRYICAGPQHNKLVESCGTGGCASAGVGKDDQCAGDGAHLCSDQEVTNTTAPNGARYWTCDSTAADWRYICDDKKNKIIDFCSSGCRPMGVGQDDLCW